MQKASTGAHSLHFCMFLVCSTPAWNKRGKCKKVVRTALLPGISITHWATDAAILLGSCEGPVMGSFYLPYGTFCYLNDPITGRSTPIRQLYLPYGTFCYLNRPITDPCLPYGTFCYLNDLIIGVSLTCLIGYGPIMGRFKYGKVPYGRQRSVMGRFK